MFWYYHKNKPGEVRSFRPGSNPSQGLTHGPGYQYIYHIPIPLSQPCGSLADALGHADAVLKGAEAECKVLKDEFKSRGLIEVAGNKFTVTATEQIAGRLDATAVKEYLGESYHRFEKWSSRPSFASSPCSELQARHSAITSGPPARGQRCEQPSIRRRQQCPTQLTACQARHPQARPHFRKDLSNNSDNGISCKGDAAGDGGTLAPPRHLAHQRVASLALLENRRQTCRQLGSSINALGIAYRP